MPFSVLFQPDMATLSALVEYLTDADITYRNPVWINSALGRRFQQYSVFWTESFTPGHFVAWNPDQMVLGIMGASTPRLFLNLFTGAFFPMVKAGAANVNRGTLPAAQQIVTNVSAAVPNFPLSLVIVGHSYGGALAQSVAAILAPQLPGTTIQVLTLGSPRIGDTSLSAAMGGVTLMRVFNEGDLIPRFPTHFSEAPTGMIALGLVATYQWNQFVQAGGGHVLDSLGRLAAQQLPALNYPILDVDLALWLQSRNALLSNEHSDHTYTTRLSLGASSTPAPAPPENVAGFKGELQPFLSDEVFLAGPVAGPALLLMGGLIVQSVYIPPQFRFKWLKVGLDYQVIWMSLLIAKGVSKSNARTMAKAGNKMLRVMQTLKSVDHTQFGAALQQYLAVASSSTNGFQPVLTVT